MSNACSLFISCRYVTTVPPRLGRVIGTSDPQLLHSAEGFKPKAKETSYSLSELE